MEKDFEKLINDEKKFISNLVVDAVAVVIVALILGIFSKMFRYVLIAIALICATMAIWHKFKLLDLINEKKQADKKEKEERERKEREQQESLERLRLENEERKKKQQEARQSKIEQFNFTLTNIPKVNIEVSDNKVYNNLVSEMPEIKFTKPRKNSSYYSFADFVVVDIETTGLKIQNSIIEISAIKYIDFAPVEVFTTLINPDKPIPADATIVNHITDDMVADAPKIKQVIPALDKFIGNSNIVGHNLMFDLRFLYKYGYDFTLKKRKYFDTLDLARSKLKRLDDRKFDYAMGHDKDYEWDVYDYKLDTLCEYYGIYRNDAHRALSDCYATAQIFECILNTKYDLNRD